LSFPARPLGGGFALEPPCFGLCLAGGFVAATCCGGSYQHDEASPLVFLGHRVPVGPGGLGSKLESCVWSWVSRREFELRCGWYCLAWSFWRVVHFTSLAAHACRLAGTAEETVLQHPLFLKKRVCAQERSLGLVSNPSFWDKSDKDTRSRPCWLESALPKVFRRSRIWRLQLGYCPKNGQGHGSDSDRFSIDPSPTPDRDQGNWVYSQSLQMIAAQVVITPLPWVMG